MQSFESLAGWIKEAKYHTKNNCVYILVENKNDIKDKRVLSTEEGKMIAAIADGEFFSISAKDCTGIQDMMKLVIEKLYFENVKID